MTRHPELQRCGRTPGAGPGRGAPYRPEPEKGGQPRDGVLSGETPQVEGGRGRRVKGRRRVGPGHPWRGESTGPLFAALCDGLRGACRGLRYWRDKREGRPRKGVTGGTGRAAGAGARTLSGVGGTSRVTVARGTGWAGAAGVCLRGDRIGATPSSGSSCAASSASSCRTARGRARSSTRFPTGGVGAGRARGFPVE